MTRYLLDTNILSEMVRAPDGPLARRIRDLPAGMAGISIIAVAEIRFGLAKRASRPLAERTLLTLEAFPILPFEAPADEIYGDIRAGLERGGTPIGANDLFIAAHALALDCTLVTGNEREFRRVPRLRIENWLG